MGYTPQDIFDYVKEKELESAFVSRFNDSYNIHFLIHPCKEADKADYEDEILNRVIRYMIMNTIVSLRLDSPEKIDDYI